MKQPQAGIRDGLLGYLLRGGFGSAIAMWYVPYFRGAPEERKREYLLMYAGTRQVLPPRGDNPCPNLLHVCFHALFVVNFLLVVILRGRLA